MTDDLLIDMVDLFPVNIYLQRLDLKIGRYIHLFSFAVKKFEQEASVHARFHIAIQGALIQCGDDGSIAGIRFGNGKIVGYGYVGSGNGPFAVLDDNDFPAVLAHAESLMAEKGGEFGAEVPLVNVKAIQYFIERRYQIDSFSALLMSNVPFGRFENYLCFSPEFFL